MYINHISSLIYIIILQSIFGGGIDFGLATFVGPLMSCNKPIPVNASQDICGDLCGKEAFCVESGACICSKEPGASMIGGHPTHCTHWCYAEQKECLSKCELAGKNDHRVCWTFTIGNFCTCFDNKAPSKPPC